MNSARELTRLLESFTALAESYVAALDDADGPGLVELRHRLAEVDRHRSEAVREALKALVRRSLRPVDPAELPTHAAVYLISADAAFVADAHGDASYVGIAKDTHARFHRPDFGHLTQNSTRSRAVLDQDGWQVGLLEEHPGLADTDANALLARREVFWFCVLRAAGARTVNQVANLAKTSDAEELPVVALELVTGKARVFRSQSEAQRVLKLPAGRVAPVVCGWQRQNGGFTFRTATPREAERIGDGWFDGTELTGDAVVERRGRRLRWSAGPLPEPTRAALAATVKGTYCPTRRSGLRGVSPHADGVSWVARYVFDAERRNAPRYLPGKYPTAEGAARAREAFLDANPQFAVLNQRNDVTPLPDTAH